LSGQLRHQLAITTCTFLSSVSIGLTIPLLALALSMDGATSFAIGVNALSAAIGIAVMSFIAPRLIAASGPRTIIILCAVIFSSFLIALFFYRGLWTWFAFRFFIGCATGTFWIASSVWLNAVTETSVRGRTIYWFGAANSLGLAIGPLALLVTGTTTAVPYIVALLIWILGTAFVVPLENNKAPAVAGNSASLTFMISRAPTAMGCAFVSGFIGSAQMVQLPLYAEKNGLSAALGAISLTVLYGGAIGSRIFLASWADKVSRAGSLRSTLIFAVLSSAALMICPAASLPYWIMLFIWGGSIFTLNSVALLLVGDRFVSPALVSATAAIRLLYTIGNVFGPMTAGFLMDFVSTAGLMAMSFAVCSIFLVAIKVDNGEWLTCSGKL
jgi:MFS family permease